MSEDGAARRKRLKDLKEKAGKSIKFRNYRPQDAAARQQASSDSKVAGGAKGGAGAGGKSKPALNVSEEGMANPGLEIIVCGATVHTSAAAYTGRLYHTSGLFCFLCWLRLMKDHTLTPSSLSPEQPSRRSVLL